MLVFGGYDGFDCGANRVHRPMLSLVEGQWAFVSSPPAWSCAGDGDLYPVRVDDTRKKEKNTASALTGRLLARASIAVGGQASVERARFSCVYHWFTFNIQPTASQEELAVEGHIRRKDRDERWRRVHLIPVAT